MEIREQKPSAWEGLKFGAGIIADRQPRWTLPILLKNLSHSESNVVRIIQLFRDLV
jgi:hypothetical protein